MNQRVAVIGAGLAGLSCARVLRQAGLYVDVFERDRIIGGRMATARLGMATFDHGAQYLTARGSVFCSYLDELSSVGYAAWWLPRAQGGEQSGQLHPWYVGTPGMSIVVRPLAESVRIHTNRNVHTTDTSGKALEIGSMMRPQRVHIRLWLSRFRRRKRDCCLAGWSTSRRQSVGRGCHLAGP